MLHRTCSMSPPRRFWAIPRRSYYGPHTSSTSRTLRLRHLARPARPPAQHSSLSAIISQPVSASQSSTCETRRLPAHAHVRPPGARPRWRIDGEPARAPLRRGEQPLELVEQHRLVGDRHERLDRRALPVLDEEVDPVEAHIDRERAGPGRSTDPSTITRTPSALAAQQRPTPSSRPSSSIDSSVRGLTTSARCG